MLKNYLRKIEKYKAVEDLYNEKIKRIQNLRLVSFLSLILFLALSLEQSIFLAFALVSIITFIYFIKLFNRFEERLKYISAKILYCEKNIARIEVNWEKLKPEIRDYPKESLFLDFDIFGERSLFNLMALDASKMGNEKLKEHFVSYNKAKNYQEIHESIRELKSHRFLSSNFFAQSRLAMLNQYEIDTYFDWLQEEQQFSPIDRLIKYLPLLTIPLFIFKLSSIFYILIFFQFTYVLVQQGKWRKIYWNLLEKQSVFKAFARQINFIRKRRFKSSLILKLFDRLNETDYLDELELLTRRLSLSFNSMLYIIINTFTFWDIWYCEKLIKWKKHNAVHLPKDLESLSEFEVYLSLSNFYSIFPNYTFPEFAEQKLVCEELGHPFIKEQDRVDNDFTLKNGEIVIITGSNMAGKTTFLRTVAINLFLAAIGSVTVSRKMICDNFALLSSIKISDSLNDGVSFFYAEVKRLKEIISSFEKNKVGIIFIDEMLKGTNNRERTIASKNIISQLVEKGASGFFSTHDLELINLEKDFAGNIVNYHFAEADNTEALSFDYKIKKGAVRSTNAIKILTKEGLYKDNDKFK